MRYEVISAIRDCGPALSANEKQFLMTIESRNNDNNDGYWAKRDNLWLDLSWSKAKTYKLLPVLLERKLVTSQFRGNDKATIYWVNLEIVEKLKGEYAASRQSQNETVQEQESQNETGLSQNETTESQNETEKSQNETEKSQNEYHKEYKKKNSKKNKKEETAESQNETPVKGGEVDSSLIEDSDSVPPVSSNVSTDASVASQQVTPIKENYKMNFPEFKSSLMSVNPNLKFDFTLFSLLMQEHNDQATGLKPGKELVSVGASKQEGWENESW